MCRFRDNAVTVTSEVMMLMALSALIGGRWDVIGILESIYEAGGKDDKRTIPQPSRMQHESGKRGRLCTVSSQFSQE